MQRKISASPREPMPGRPKDLFRRGRSLTYARQLQHKRELRAPDWRESADWRQTALVNPHAHQPEFVPRKKLTSHCNLASRRVGLPGEDRAARDLLPESAGIRSARQR